MNWYVEMKKKHIVRENPSVVAFRAAMARAISAIEKGEKPNNRSLVKKSDSGEWLVKLGKITGTYVFASEAEALKCLRDASFHADKDQDLLAEIEEAYGVDNGVKTASADGEKKRGGGRPKGSKNKPKDNAGQTAEAATADAGNTEQAA